MQHMLFDKSFYLKCPMSPQSTYIFCMGGHTGKKATKSGSISVTTLKLRLHILLCHLCFVDIVVSKVNITKAKM